MALELDEMELDELDEDTRVLLEAVLVLADELPPPQAVITEKSALRNKALAAFMKNLRVFIFIRHATERRPVQGDRAWQLACKTIGKSKFTDNAFPKKLKNMQIVEVFFVIDEVWLTSRFDISAWHGDGKPVLI